MFRARASFVLIALTLGAWPTLATAQEVNLTGDLTPAAAQRRTEALCRSAGQLVANGVEDKQARRLYLRALRTGAPRTECAADGLKSLADAAQAAKDAETQPTAIDKAEALLAQGYAAEAENEIAKLLGEDPTQEVPAELQKDDRAIAIAEGLAAQGYESEAQKKVQEALAANPNVDVPLALQQVERKPGWLRERLGWIGGWLVPLVLFLGGALIVLAIGRILWAHLKRRIVPEALVGGDDRWRDVLYAEMRQQFELWGQGRATHRLAASAGPLEKLTLPANVTNLVPQANMILDLMGAVDRALPARSWQLSGYLLPAEPERGVGVALMLSRKTFGKILAAETLKEADFLALPKETATDDEKALAWRRLGLAGAALVLCTDSEHRKVFPDHFGRLGTRDWKAYAMAMSAATYYEWDLQTARRLYRQAIARDHRYRDARFSLAVVDLRLAQGDKHELERIDCRLADLLDELDPSKHALWYRVQLWRVIVRIQRRLYRLARKEAVKLFEQAQWWNPPKALRTFLDDALAGSLVPLAVALALTETDAGELADNLRTKLVLDSGPVTGGAIVKALKADRKRCSQAAYGLAGYYAVCRQADWVDDALEQLEIALDRGGPDLARVAWEDFMLNNLRAENVVTKFKATLTAAGYTPNGAALLAPRATSARERPAVERQTIELDES